MRARLLSVEIDLDDLEGSVNILNASIAHAEVTLVHLSENLETLRAHKIIASLEQFRISSRQVGEVSKKLALMRSRRSMLIKKIKNKEENREYYINELNKALDERDSLDNNIVLHMDDFRSKK